MTTGRVPQLDTNGQFPDRFAPPSVAANTQIAIAKAAAALESAASASGSAGTATAQATAASGSATAASGSATGAGSSATAASGSATAASGSATASGSSATASAGSATLAGEHRAAVEGFAVTTAAQVDAVFADPTSAPSIRQTATFAPTSQNGVMAHASRFAEVKNTKGGRIGTGGKGVIAFRIDHGIDRFRSIHWPLMRDRYLSCGFGFVSGSVENPTAAYEPSTTTWAQARLMHYEGAESWGHSADHGDPAPLGASPFTLEQQIQGCRATLEAQMLHPVGWQMPGVTGGVTPGYSSNLDTLGKLGTTEAGQRLMAGYGLIENYLHGSTRIMPTDGCYLLSHVTLDTMTLAGAKSYVDLAISEGVGIEMMFHPMWVGTTGFMSIADFTAVLDYVAAKRAAELLEVLTPSGLAFADPGTSYRLNLLNTSGFEGSSKVGGVIGAWTATVDAGIALRQDGGHTGLNYVRFSGTNNLLEQPFKYVDQGGYHNAALEVSAWVRNTTASAAQARIKVFVSSPGGYPDLGTQRDGFYALPANTPWTKIRLPFCMPRSDPGGAPTEHVAIRIARLDTGTTPGDVDFDDIQMNPI
ncbi:hypothetical protein [Cryobacterium sp. Y11]|uniref:hypothetical protein n=1 Tax=Cryobacterium sp. Y11 TaxID=2045016 RepID=UPI0011B075D5|nr:hypothetical protein [Cryobacterium sp. Y11]